LGLLTPYAYSQPFPPFYELFFLSQLLLAASAPGTVAESDLMSALPLHWACGSQSLQNTELHPAKSAAQPYPACVRRLLSLYPEGARKKMKHGRLPLHYLASRSKSVAAAVVLDDVLEAYSDAVSEKTLDMQVSAAALSVSVSCAVTPFIS
jgi:hypothetical protein